MKEKLEQIRIDVADIRDSVKKQVTDTVNNLNDVINLTNRLIDTVDLALQHLNPLTDFTVEWENGDIRVRWKAQTEGTFDILYQAPEKHSTWHSYAENVAPIDLKDETVIIGVNINEDFVLRAVKDGEIIAGTELTKTDTKPSGYDFKFWFWWDTMMEGESFSDFPYANGVKIDADNLAQAINSDAKYVIPFIGFRNSDIESDTTIRKRIQGQTNGWDDLDLSKVEVVILDDEPTYGKEIQEQIVRVFQEEYPNLKCTFSYSGNYIIAEKTLAENLKHVHVNVYPFMEEGYSSFWGHIDSKQKFHEAFDRFMKRLRSVSPDGVTFSITMQTFAMKFDGEEFEWKRTPPPPEAPIWYAEAMTRHSIEGGLSYLYKTKKNEDLIAIDMPELLENIEEVYNQLK